jgi:hypothetical protein
MDWLLDHAEAAAAMGEAGRRRMQEQYEIAVLIDQHVNLYSALLADRPVPVQPH